MVHACWFSFDIVDSTSSALHGETKLSVTQNHPDAEIKHVFAPRSTSICTNVFEYVVKK